MAVGPVVVAGCVPEGSLSVWNEANVLWNAASLQASLPPVKSPVCATNSTSGSALIDAVRLDIRTVWADVYGTSPMLANVTVSPAAA